MVDFYFPILYVTSNETRICDIDFSWPGKAHDARVYNASEVKMWLEGQQTFKAAGDSAYPISKVMMKPYSQAVSERDPRMRLFNRRLSGLCTVMSKCVFGR